MPLGGDKRHLPPISVCLTVGFSSWYKHMRRRSLSVNVFRGVDEERVEVAETGVGVAETGTGAGAEYMGGGA